MSFEIEEVHDVEAVWPALEGLLLGLLEYHRPWDNRTLRADWAQRMRDVMTRSGNLTLLARDDAGRSVAFLNGVVSKDQGMFEEVSAFVNNIYVEPEARALGAGSALLQRFEEWARAGGATEIRLHVNAGNLPGQTFWNARGFLDNEHALRKPLGPGL